jgi:hypothetical protein
MKNKIFQLTRSFSQQHFSITIFLVKQLKCCRAPYVLSFIFFLAGCFSAFAGDGIKNNGKNPKQKKTEALFTIVSNCKGPTVLIL